MLRVYFHSLCARVWFSERGPSRGYHHQRLCFRTATREI